MMTSQVAIRHRSGGRVSFLRAALSAAGAARLAPAPCKKGVVFPFVWCLSDGSLGEPGVGRPSAGRWQGRQGCGQLQTAVEFIKRYFIHAIQATVSKRRVRKRA